MSGEGKTVGIAGGILAAIGAAVAHGADDCGRAGARIGSHAADDLARPAAIAPRLGGGVGDDLGRGVSRTGVPGAALDDIAKGSPSEKVIEGLAEEGSMQALDLLLDESDPEPEGAAGAPSRAFRPLIVALLPDTLAKSATERAELDKSVRAFDAARRVRSRAEVLDHAATAGALPIWVLGYADKDQPERLISDDGTVSVVELSQRCARSARQCVILACEGLDFGARSASCARSTALMLQRSLALSPASERELLRQLLADRAQSGERRLTLHRLLISGQKLRLVHSRPE